MTDLQRFKDLHPRVDAAHKEVFEACYHLGTTVQQRLGEVSSAELTDVGFLLREYAEMLDSARRELESRRRELEKLLARRLAKAAINSSDASAAQCKGDLATATVNVKAVPSLPKKHTPEWNSLLDSMGVNPEARDSRLVELHWPSVAQWLTDLEHQGRPLPPELANSVRMEPTVTFRRKRKS